MKNLLLKTVLLGVATVAAFAFSAPTTTAALPAANDLIWDANATLGQVVLKAKYKESPDNGLIDQSFQAEVKNILPGIEVFFSVNDIFLGSAVSDAVGTAQFTLDRFGMSDDGTGRVDGPRGETGDMVRAYRGTSSIEAPLVPRP